MKSKVITEVKNLEVNPSIVYIYGSFGIVLEDKVSNYGSGKKTVYCGYVTEGINAEAEEVEIAEDSKQYFINYEITKIQKNVGYIVNGSVKTLSDEEIEKAVEKKLQKARDAKTLLQVSEFITEAEAEAINAKINSRKNELIEEYKQKRDERKNSLEKSEQAKRLQQLAKEIAEATKKGDFAKVMQLAQQQLAITSEVTE
jgi:hypothetical protein